MCSSSTLPSGCFSPLGSEGSLLCCGAVLTSLGVRDAVPTISLLPFKSVPFPQPACTLCIDSPRESWAGCVLLVKATLPMRGLFQWKFCPGSSPSFTLEPGFPTGTCHYPCSLPPTKKLTIGTVRINKCRLFVCLSISFGSPCWP